MYTINCYYLKDHWLNLACSFYTHVLLYKHFKVRNDKVEIMLPLLLCDEELIVASFNLHNEY